MKTVQTTYLLSIVCFFGCTNTYRLRPSHEESYDLLNKGAAKKQALVTFLDERQIQVENLRMTSDSTYWNSTNKIATAVATSQIKDVRFRSRGTGDIKGIGLGFLIGAAIGFTIEEDCDPGFLRPEICFPRGKTAVLLGLSGALIGATMNAQRDVYLIEHDAATGTN